MFRCHSMLGFRLESQNATKPQKRFCSDIGYVLHSSEEKIIPVDGRVYIETDIKFYFPFGYFGLITPLPCLAEKSIDVMVSNVQNGMDKIKVLLINNGNVDYKINCFDQIAFMIITKFHDHWLLLENK